MEQKHANEHLHWPVIDEEEQEVEEEVVLKGRQARKQLEDNDVSTMIPSSSPSFSPTSNGGSGYANNVASLDSDPEEPLLQKDEQIVAEMGDIAEDDNSHCHEEKVDNAAVGLGLVAEFAGAAPSKGEAIISDNTAITATSQNKNSVYFDKQEGSEANNVPHEVQNGDGARSYLPTHNGIGESNLQVENPNIQKSPCNGVSNHDMKIVEDKGRFNSELPPLHDSSEIETTDVKHFDDETSTKAGPELIEEIDQRLKELDVEAVLVKQETHDLFCPNCNSCITKRIILRKRKRSIRKMDNKSKRDKLDTLVTEQVDSAAHEANKGDHANSSSDAGHSEQQPPLDNDPVQEQEVFRCLECFSIFIPSGNCFKLFWNFSVAHEQETSRITSTIPASDIQNPSSITVPNVNNSSNTTVSNVQNPSTVAGSNGNWFFSLFTSKKGKTFDEQGNASSKHSETGPAEQKQSSSIASDVLNSLENGHLDNPVTDTNIIDNGKTVPDVKPGRGGLNGNVVTHVGEERNGPADIKKTDHSEAHNVANLPSKNFSGNIVSKHEKDLLATAITSQALINPGGLAKDATLKPGEGETDFLVQSTVGSRSPEKSLKDIDKTPEIFQNGYSSLIMQEATIANDAVTGTKISGPDAKISFGEDLRLKKKVEKDTEGETKPAASNGNKGSDVIVEIEEDKIKSDASQLGDTGPVKGAISTDTASQVYVGEQSRAEIGEPRGWEILKSIAYGGLVESVTSLGIVSSAVSSGAAPLNIIALGLANMIGGLFIIGHNLLELKDDKSGEDLQQTNTQEDQYQELLGRRENFILHAVVAILSFLIFGSVPIVIYGILIHKNYQTEVKLAAVAATSLVCIILLAIGKVYTKRPPKSYSKTVFYYVTMALVASGVSYIVGGLIKDLLERLSNSEASFVITLPLSGQGTMDMDPAWRSY